MCHLMAAWPPARIERAQGFIRWLVRPGSARFCQPYFLTPTRAVARSEQIEARGRRNPEAYAVYVEGFRRPRTKRCEAYRHGISQGSPSLPLNSEGDLKPIVGSLETEIREVRQHVGAHVGEDETLAVEPGAVPHEGRVVEMEAHGVRVEVGLADEEISAGYGGNQTIRPLGVARVDDRPT